MEENRKWRAWGPEAWVQVVGIVVSTILGLFIYLRVEPMTAATVVGLMVFGGLICLGVWKRPNPTAAVLAVILLAMLGHWALSDFFVAWVEHPTGTIPSTGLTLLVLVALVVLTWILGVNLLRGNAQAPVRKGRKGQPAIASWFAEITSWGELGKVTVVAFVGGGLFLLLFSLADEVVKLQTRVKNLETQKVQISIQLPEKQGIKPFFDHTYTWHVNAIGDVAVTLNLESKQTPVRNVRTQLFIAGPDLNPEKPALSSPTNQFFNQTQALRLDYHVSHLALTPNQSRLYLIAHLSYGGSNQLIGFREKCATARFGVAWCRPQIKNWQTCSSTSRLSSQRNLRIFERAIAGDWKSGGPCAHSFSLSHT